MGRAVVNHFNLVLRDIRVEPQDIPFRAFGNGDDPIRVMHREILPLGRHRVRPENLLNHIVNGDHQPVIFAGPNHSGIVPRQMHNVIRPVTQLQQQIHG